ncbi:MAG: hypothetical protein AAF333_04400 [Planctomycetota bacterium]
MTETSHYYVRLARTVEGPLSRDELRERLRLNLLSTYHEVSTDQQNWRSLDPAGLGGLLDDLEPAEANDTDADPKPIDAAWLATLNGLDATPADDTDVLTEAPPTTRPIRGLVRSIALSSGLLLVIATSFSIPRGDGTGVRWWQHADALSGTLGVWSVLGLAAVAVAFLPDLGWQRRALLALGGLGWICSLLLLRGDEALRVTAALWYWLAPATAWAAAYTIRGTLAGVAPTPTDTSRRTRFLGVAASAGAAGLSAVILTLTSRTLPVWWIAVLGLGLSPAAWLVSVAIRQHGGQAARQRPDTDLIILALLNLGLLAAVVVLGVQQNLAAGGPHHLGQLVVTSVGFIALTACVVTAGLESKPEP